MLLRTCRSDRGTYRYRRCAGPMQRKWKTRMQRAWLINPGWSLPALEYLYEQRKIAALGYETTHTDPGIAYDSSDYSLETCILSTKHYQIEVADEFRSGSGGWRYCRSQFSETKERLGVSNARICNRA